MHAPQKMETFDIRVIASSVAHQQQEQVVAEPEEFRPFFSKR
jgi:hypothetical protein